MNILTTLTRRIGLAATVATVGLSGLVANPADAGMEGAAVVECNSAYNTLEVTPRVLSDGEAAQYTATRVWIAHWDAASRSWGWTPQDWAVELASVSNSPIATDIARLETRRFDLGDGYYYVYVESWMWDGTRWYGHDGAYTRTYTQVTPSVSFEPDARTQANYCTL